MYDRGWGVPQDDREALRLYRQSADLGFGQCQFNLGVFYRDGRGTARDPLASYLWFSLADRAGTLKPDVKANDMRRSLTPAQLADAEWLLALWQPTSDQ